MDLLKAVNLILPALGDHTITRVDAQHPTLAVILPVLDLKIRELLMRGWWFNEGPLTLYPDSEGFIAIPTNTLSFLPDEYGATIRKDRLYDMNTRGFLWSVPVRGQHQEFLEFEELPESVATLAFYSTLVQVYLVDIGLESVVAEWQKLALAAEQNASLEHLRNKRYTTRNSPRYKRYRGALRG